MALEEMTDIPYDGGAETTAERSTTLETDDFTTNVPMSAGMTDIDAFMLDVTAGGEVRMDKVTRAGDFEDLIWVGAIDVYDAAVRPIVGRLTPDGMQHFVYPVSSISVPGPAIMRSDVGSVPGTGPQTLRQIDESTWGGDAAHLVLPLPVGWVPPEP